ncbi:MAG: bifunctional ADP-dependent NAD(P)H-hydrate dehydratase/NAD(P)H-hydrate epimerase [Coriobacteriia bacterium]
MRYALTAGQMQEAERETVERGTTVESLMTRAGTAVAEEVFARVALGPTVVVAGKGNNGGDGWVAARILHEGGREVEVLALVAPDELAGAAHHAAQASVAAGVPFRTLASARELADALAGATCVVDAIFGLGFAGEAREPYASAIRAIDGSEAHVVAVDIPSGVHADTGVVGGPAVRADVTVTFSAPKAGCVLEPGASFAGEVVVADVGVSDELLAPAGALELWEPAEYAAILPAARPIDHKGSRGRVLVVAGSQSFAGAAVLATGGAVRMGAGYVRAAVPAPVTTVVQHALPQAITAGMSADESGAFAPEAVRPILHLAAESDAVVVGPGITTGRGAREVVRALLLECDRPIVIDADALNVLAEEGVDLALTRPAPTLLTPHPGEMGRLLGMSPADVQSDRVARARALSGGSATCLLKGARSVICGDGRCVVNRSGGPGLAKAGTGDVLSGMLGTLLAQGVTSLEAAALGAYLHGRAGDLGADELTGRSLATTDLWDYLPRAVAELERG